MASSYARRYRASIMPAGYVRLLDANPFVAPKRRLQAAAPVLANGALLPTGAIP
jgi:hypothetical protein